MTVSRKAIAALTLLALIGATPADAARSGSVNRQFSAAVARILNSIRNQQEFLKSLSASEFRAFVSCAQNIMNGVATDQKRYVLAASSATQQKQRFDEVANKRPVDSTTTFKGRIGRECN